MTTAFVTTRRVEFSDTDAAGIMHFVAFFRMMEQAEHELLRSVGLSVIAKDSSGTITWPRVRATCDFQSAARFEDVLTIEVRIARIGKKSVTYRHRFILEGRDVASGEMTAVCCRLKAGSPPKSIAIPAAVVRKLKPFADAAAT